jgi:sugar lactone lactonase YvrE
VYALQITSAGLAAPPSPGKLVRIARDGTQTELAAGALTQPTGMAVSEDGDVYVANQGTSAQGGQIVRIPAG